MDGAVLGHTARYSGPILSTRGVGSNFKLLPYEADGTVTSYLCAGSPCIVGNLWDVTDKDIDKFFINFLAEFFEGNRDIASCVAGSRSVCKMKRVVGFAPVCFGVPITFGEDNE